MSSASQYAMKNRWLPFLLAVLVVVADRWSKLAIEHSMSALDSVSIIPGWLRIIHTENAGAAFGFLSEGSRWVRSGILIGVSGLVLVFVISALWSSNKTSFTTPLARIGLALVLGGALGNLFDRVMRGTVTDFIEVYHGNWAFPAFNVADSAITVGAALLLFELLWQPRANSSSKEAGLVHR